MKTGIELISEERQKQIDKYGFTPQHHIEHPEWYENKQLQYCATTLLMHEFVEGIDTIEHLPQGWDLYWFRDLNSRTRKERMIIAAALIAAEIDRIEALLPTEIELASDMLNEMESQMFVEGLQKCRVCGCTEIDCSQCIEKDGYPCHWVEDDLCSSCVNSEKRLDNQVWINNDCRKIIVSDMPILPVGFQLLKEYEDWQTAVSFADTFNIALHYDIEYDNDYTRNNWEEEDDDDDDKISDAEMQEIANRKVYQDYFKKEVNHE